MKGPTPDGIVARTIDGALGRWTFLEWRPARLRAWIDGLWLFDGSMALRRERTFPCARLDVMLQLEGRYRPGDDPAAEPFPTASVNGVLLGPQVVVSPRTRVRVLGIGIRPAGAHALLGGAVPDLTGVTVDLRDILGAQAEALAGRCHERSNEDALLEAAQFVEGRLARTSDPDDAITWVADRLEATAGTAAIGRLAEKAGISTSTLARRFRERTGLTPKRMARIHRFRRVLDALHVGACRSLSSLALDAGYYDQPHMNAEFRELAGLSPTEYLAATPYPGSPSLAEAN